MASFWAELSRRNVVRVAIAYSAAIWALLQVADLVLSNLGAPAWIIQVLIVAAAIGFPVAVVLAWLFDITPDGIKAAADVPTGSKRRFSAHQVNLAIIALLIVAISFLVVDNYVWVDAPREPSIAVLPFTNMSVSGDERTEVFSIGMYDSLLTQLAKIEGIKVISRTSMLEYANRGGLTIPEIADALGVATVLEATVLQSGDELQINAQLINGVTDGHLWGDVFDRELTAENFFAVQRELATSIAGILRTTLTPSELAALDRVPTQNERALRLFLTGNDFARRPNERDFMPRAVDAYREAVNEDPDFLDAWAALAEAHVQIYGMGGDRSPDRALLASEALRRASALDPDSPEVHRAAGMYAMFVEQDIDAAIAENEAALRGLPGSADVLNSLASTYRRAGRYDESLVYRLRAMELDPRNVDALLSLGGGTYARMRDYDAAAETLQQALEISPDSAMIHWANTLIPYWRDGDVSAMRALAADPPVELGRFGVRARVFAARYDRDPDAVLEMLENLDPNKLANEGKRPVVNERFRLLSLGQAYQLAGRDEEADRQFEALLERTTAALESDDADITNRLYQGAAFAGLGQTEAAIDVGQRTLELAEAIVNPDEVEDVRVDAVLMIFGPVGDVDLTVESLEMVLSAPGVFSIEALLRDPSLDAVKEHPRFRELVQRFSRNPQSTVAAGAASAQ